MRSLTLVRVAVLLACPLAASAQDVFHSTQVANLQTAVIHPRRTLLFEISHRFDTPISDGASAFWGLDGPVRNRLGLTYSVTNRVSIGAQRSNLDDNAELNAKFGLLQSRGGGRLALEAAVMAGVAWNTQVVEVDGAEDNEMQAYGQVILNARVGERIALGVVPTYLRNPRLADFETDNALALGIGGQLYATDAVSLLVEWLVAGERAGQENDAATFGVELETRGHFFKLLLTNTARLNSSQFLGGTPTDFEPDEWRFGFNIQRRLAL